MVGAAVGISDTKSGEFKGRRVGGGRDERIT